MAVKMTYVHVCVLIGIMQNRGRLWRTLHCHHSVIYLGVWQCKTTNDEESCYCSYWLLRTVHRALVRQQTDSFDASARRMRPAAAERMASCPCRSDFYSSAGALSETAQQTTHAVVAARENWHDSPLRPTDDHASLKLLHVTHTQNCWRSRRIIKHYRNYVYTCA